VFPKTLQASLQNLDPIVDLNLGERTRLASWLRRLAVTNFKSSGARRGGQIDELRLTQTLLQLLPISLTRI